MSDRRAATVMVVDDDDDLRDTIVEALGCDGYETISFRDGSEALAALRDGAAPDLLLLDLMMPGMSGFEVYEALRETPALQALPVLLMTAMRSSERPAGIRDVDTVLKPFLLNHLPTRVAAKLDGVGARAAS